MERLSQANKENVRLKALGKFSVEQALNTMKRLVEDIYNHSQGSKSEEVTLYPPTNTINSSPDNDTKDSELSSNKESKRYTYCPCCKTDDKKGYRGKRCKWCSTLLVKDPLDEIFVTSPNPKTKSSCGVKNEDN